MALLKSIFDNFIKWKNSTKFSENFRGYLYLIFWGENVQHTRIRN